MSIWVGVDVDRFTAEAGTLLDARVEHNILASVLDGVRRGVYPEALFAVVTAPTGAVTAAAIRTPPHNLLVAGEIIDPASFVTAWRRVDPDAPALSGEPAPARATVAAWCAQSGQVSHLHMTEALHVLRAVTSPAPPIPGRLRHADWREGAQMREWGHAFGVDARVRQPDLLGAAIQSHLDRESLYVWELEGRPVSMLGHIPLLGDGVRIGPVYTPAECRGHGYATAATAALSQRLLDGGARQCLLYTDLANPISNHIYAKVGYVPVGRWEEYTFHSATAGVAPRGVLE